MRWSPFSAMNPAAVGQQTLVGRVIASGQTMRGSKSAAPKRRRKASRKTASRKQTRARLVKGSTAAKAYMAKIRRKRRK
jgi:hypothetical protein